MTDNPDISPHLKDGLVDIIKDAGTLALDYFQRADINKWNKKPDDPVSEADLAVDAFLREKLTALAPSAGWLSEETEDDAERLACPAVWIVDPIDGTRSFLKQRTDWAISVAYVVGSQPKLAALYAPSKRDLYLAQAGEGATVNGAKAKVSTTFDLAKSRMMGDETAFRSPYWPVAWPDTMTVTATNSIALRLCMIADGTADACVTLRPKHDWDIAAAHLILKEAGGLLETADKSAIDYNRPSPYHGSIVASNGALQPHLFDRITPAVAAWRKRQAETAHKKPAND